MIMSEHNKIDLIEFPADSASELSAVQNFFTNVFGWSFKVWGDEYIDTADSGVTSGVNATDPKMRQKMPLTVIYVEDLEVTKEKIVSSGGTILIDTYAFPGGRRFHFSDPAGNELAVWSK